MPRLFTLGLLLLAATASAQPTAERAACTFDTCAIWIEDGLLLGEIRRGDTTDSERIRGVGLFGGGLVDHVEGVPLAEAEAGRARGLRTAWLATAVASGAFSVAAAAFAISGDDDSTADVLSLASVGLTVYSSIALLRARRAESRAVYAYNRQFAD